MLKSNQNHIVLTILTLLTIIAVWGQIAIAMQTERGKNKLLSIGSNPNLIAQQKTLFVNPVTGNDSASGENDGNPLRTISVALQKADSGTTIQLLSGQYGKEETFPLVLKPGVILKGTTDKQGQEVIIKGGGRHLSPSFAKQNVTIVTSDNNQIIGVTITDDQVRGTGIWVENSNPLISNSTFIFNQREGIFVTGQSNPNIQSNVFKYNSGNGIAVTGEAKGEIMDDVFEQTGYGIVIGGSSAPRVKNSQFRKNRSGILINENAKPTLDGNIMENNTDYDICDLTGNFGGCKK